MMFSSAEIEAERLNEIAEKTLMQQESRIIDNTKGVTDWSIFKVISRGSVVVEQNVDYGLPYRKRNW
jgi:hypothetical protein